MQPRPPAHRPTCWPALAPAPAPAALRTVRYGQRMQAREVNVLCTLHDMGCSDCLVRPLAIFRDCDLVGCSWLGCAEALATRLHRKQEHLLLPADRPAGPAAACCPRPLSRQPLHGYVMPAYRHGSLATLLHRTCHRCMHRPAGGLLCSSPPAMRLPRRPPPPAACFTAL